MSREPAVIVALRSVYRRFAGPEASLTHIPRAILRRFFGPDFTIKIEGKPFTVNLYDAAVSANILAYRTYEVLETALMKKLVKPGFRALDIGANIGFFSVLLGDLVGPQGRVAAFEPEPTNARLLARNVRDRNLSDVVTVVAAAVGEADGSAKLFLASDNMGDHRLYSANEAGWNPKERQSIDVPVVRVDDVVAQWPRVDFIKMDIQGFELYAIRGMKATLSNNPDLIMLTEFWPFGLRATGSDPVDYLNVLRDLGFHLWDVRDETASLELLDPSGDAAFIERIEPDLNFANLLCARSFNAFDGISPLIPVRTKKSCAMKRSPIVDKNYTKLVEYRLEGLAKAGARHAGRNKKLKPRLFWPTVFPRGIEFPNGSVPLLRWQITSPFPAFTLGREVLAPLGRPVRVLDVGCGKGDLYYFLKACPEIEIAQYAGVDIADVAVDFPVYTSVTDVPKGERFDLIMMSEIIEHMPYADFVEEFLAFIGEYVAPGGALVLGAPNPLLPAMLERDVTHVQHYPWYDLYALLRFFFEDVTIVRAYGLAEFRRILALPLKIAVSSILECDWCEGVLAVARKPALGIVPPTPGPGF